MALIVADRVLETSTTTGTGSYTLAGALTGYRAASAVCANADTFTYYAEDVDSFGRPLGGWETGLGTWLTGNILARTTIYASSNANAAVSWAAGTRRIGLSVNTNAALGPTTVVGAFNATTKSFLITHPIDPTMQLRYGSLESPYHGVRLTGEGEVIGGICLVNLPNYIHGLCKQEGAQVQITNICHGEILWVNSIEVENDRFCVACKATNEAYKFYWSFTAIRKDVLDIIVEE